MLRFVILSITFHALCLFHKPSRCRLHPLCLPAFLIFSSFPAFFPCSHVLTPFLFFPAPFPVTPNLYSLMFPPPYCFNLPLLYPHFLSLPPLSLSPLLLLLSLPSYPATACTCFPFITVRCLSLLIRIHLISLFLSSYLSFSFSFFYSSLHLFFLIVIPALSSTFPFFYILTDLSYLICHGPFFRSFIFSHPIQPPPILFSLVSLSVFS